MSEDRIQRQYDCVSAPAGDYTIKPDPDSAAGVVEARNTQHADPLRALEHEIAEAALTVRLLERAATLGAEVLWGETRERRDALLDQYREAREKEGGKG